jgi:hypothetical protein
MVLGSRNSDSDFRGSGSPDRAVDDVGELNAVQEEAEPDLVDVVGLVVAAELEGWIGTALERLRSCVAVAAARSAGCRVSRSA